MSEPTSEGDPTPVVPPAPSFTYGTPAPAAAAPPPPVGQPLPAYGEQIPGYVQPVYGAPAAVRPRRTWDLVLTIILLVVGLFGMGIGLIYAALFSDASSVQQIFDEAYRQQGLGGWNGTVGAQPAIIAISHVVLYLAAVGVSVLLLVKRRVAFWVPLTAGVIAAIIFWVGLVSIVLSDPSLLSGRV